MLSQFLSAAGSNGFVDKLQRLWNSTGFAQGGADVWKNYLMLLIASILFFLAVKKQFEPLLLLPIAFGMFVINIPGGQSVLMPIAEQKHAIAEIIKNNDLVNVPDAQSFFDVFLKEGGSRNVELLQYAKDSLGNLIKMTGDGAVSGSYDSFVGSVIDVMRANNGLSEGLFDYLYFGVEKVIFPPLIFLGIGAMTDFGPLISNPKSLILGAAAQLGIFITLIGAILLGFDPKAAASIAIIGGADGPTAIYLTSKMGQTDLLPIIAIAAYSYMALIPVIQPPIMKMLTTKKERKIRMVTPRKVTKTEKVIFPIVVTLLVSIILPSALPLIGMLMLGNLLRESLVTERLAKTASNELINIVTIFLGVVVGAKAFGPTFLTPQSLYIIVLGLIAFCIGTTGGVLFGKVLCAMTKGKVNPLIGAAGVSAVPMAARVAQKVGQDEDKQNYLLMHAMGPNVAGVIGSAVAAGFLLAWIGG